MSDFDNREEPDSLPQHTTVLPAEESQDDSGTSLISMIYKGIKFAVCASVVLSFMGSLVSGLAGTSVEEKHIIDGRKAQEAGNEGAATEAFQSVLTMKDASNKWRSVAEYELASQAYRRDEYPVASAAVTRLLAANHLPKEERLQSLMLRIFCAEKTNDFTHVEQDASEILSTPDVTDAFQAKALMMRAMALSEIGKIEEAIRDETRALELADGNKALESNIQYNRAIDYDALGRTDEAMADYSAVIKRGTPDVDILGWAYHNRSIVHADAAQYDQAIADATAQFHLPGLPTESQDLARINLASYYSGRGLEFAKAGDWEAAVADDTAGLNYAAGIRDSESQLQCNRALHYGAMGNTEDSLKDFCAVIERGSSDNEVLGIAYARRAAYRSDAGQIKEAAADCEAALKLTGTDIDTRFESRKMLCVIYEDAEDFENAFLHACAICEIEGLTQNQATMGFFVRGAFALQLGKSEQAVRDLGKARDMASEANLVELVKLIDQITPRVSDAGSDNVSR